MRKAGVFEDGMIKYTKGGMFSPGPDELELETSY